MEILLTEDWLKTPLTLKTDGNTKDRKMDGNTANRKTDGNIVDRKMN